MTAAPEPKEKPDLVPRLHTLPPPIIEEIITELLRKGLESERIKFKNGIFRTVKSKFLYSVTGKAKFSNAGRSSLYDFDRYIHYLRHPEWDKKTRCQKAAKVGIGDEAFTTIFRVCTGESYEIFLKDRWQPVPNDTNVSAYSRDKGKFENLFKWLVIPHEDEILSDDTYFIGIHANLALIALWKDHEKWLTGFLKQHKYRITIIGQNPRSPQIKQIQQRFDEPDFKTDRLFLKTEAQCFDLAEKFPDIFRCIFEYDLIDYDFQGITSLEERQFTLTIPNVWGGLDVEKVSTAKFDVAHSTYFAFGLKRLRTLHNQQILNVNWSKNKEEAQRG